MFRERKRAGVFAEVPQQQTYCGKDCIRRRDAAGCCKAAKDEYLQVPSLADDPEHSQLDARAGCRDGAIRACMQRESRTSRTE